MNQAEQPQRRIIVKDDSNSDDPDQPRSSISIRPTSSTQKRSDKSFVWTKEADDIFEELKIILTQMPMLKYPDFNKIFKIQTDASEDFIGAI